MLKKVIENGGYTVTVGTQTRLATLMRGVYRRYFVARYPTLQTALAATSGEALTAAVAALTADERDVFDLIFDFLTAATYVQQAEGFPFPWPCMGEMPSDTTIGQMFNHFLTDSEGIWREMLLAYLELAQPFGPPEQLPEAELPKVPNEDGEMVADPNSSALTSSGKSIPSVDTAPLLTDERSSNVESVMDALLKISAGTGATR